MSELQEMVTLGRRALAAGERLCLATVVDVEGSAYRKPGARMLLTSGGERAGTISGGCLEAEVCRKAWWLTSGGPRIERYSSFADDDGGLPYGLGCGGTVTLLLEQGEAARAVLLAMEQGLRHGRPGVVVSVLDESPEVPGTAAVLTLPGRSHSCTSKSAGTNTVEHPRAPNVEAVEVLYRRGTLAARALDRQVEQAAEQQQSFFLAGDGTPWDAEAAGERPAYFVEYLPAPPALTVFGAGDDAQPIATLAHTLGWRVTVADGRFHLARRDRFPQATEVRVLDYADPSLRAACGIAAGADRRATAGLGSDGLGIDGIGPDDMASDGLPNQAPALEPLACVGLASDDLAVILTHSYEQDRALLAALLPRPMRYLGILGPRHRTERLLAEVAPGLGMTLEEGFARLHSPVGLDLGSGEPAAVALSIVAEVQAVLHGRRVTVTRSRAEARPESCVRTALDPRTLPRG